MYLVLALVNSSRFSLVLMRVKLFRVVLNSCFAEKHFSSNHFGFWLDELFPLIFASVVVFLPNTMLAFSYKKVVNVSICKAGLVSDSLSI